MATTTAKTTEIELLWADGKKTTLKLPEPINMTLTDPDTGAALVTAGWFDSVSGFLENDDRASLNSASITIVETRTTPVYATVNGGGATPA